jgi:hypothetical protein
MEVLLGAPAGVSRLRSGHQISPAPRFERELRYHLIKGGNTPNDHDKLPERPLKAIETVQGGYLKCCTGRGATG